MTEEKRVTHLGFIEGAIDRMANNSSTIKGWAIAIAAAFIGVGFFKKDTEALYVWIIFGVACAITITIWCLDSFYLYQEKLYRELYKYVSTNENDLNYSMDARKETIKNLTNKEIKYFPILFNRVICPFYIPQILMYFALYVLPLFIK